MTSSIDLILIIGFIEKSVILDGTPYDLLARIAAASFSFFAKKEKIQRKAGNSSKKKPQT